MSENIILHDHDWSLSVSFFFITLIQCYLYSPGLDCNSVDHLEKAFDDIEEHLTEGR